MPCSTWARFDLGHVRLGARSTEFPKTTDLPSRKPEPRVRLSRGDQSIRCTHVPCVVGRATEQPHRHRRCQVAVCHLFSMARPLSCSRQVGLHGIKEARRRRLPDDDHPPALEAKLAKVGLAQSRPPQFFQSRSIQVGQSRSNFFWAKSVWPKSDWPKSVK